MGYLPDRSRVVLRYILERHSAECPDRECIFFEDGELWTYGEALHRAYKAANALRRLGIKRNENVLIFLPNSRDWIMAWWGINFLGAIVVPVNIAYKGEMLRHLCQDALSRYVIASPDLAERIKRLGLDLDDIIDPAILAEGPDGEPRLDEYIEPWDIHRIIYTFWTTGSSKGVLTTYLKPYMIYMKGWCRAATPDDTMLVVLPFYHQSGMDPAYNIWIAGGRLALRTVFSASRYWDIVRETGTTLTIMVGTIPAILEKMTPDATDSDNPLQVVLAVPMVRDPVSFMERFGIRELYSIYGMTETGQVTRTDGLITKPKS